MSIRDQERRERKVERKLNQQMQRADRDVGRKVALMQQQAMRRAEEVQRRIEVGDVQPRPLPSVREDSLESG